MIWLFVEGKIRGDLNKGCLTDDVSSTTVVETKRRACFLLIGFIASFSMDFGVRYIIMVSTIIFKTRIAAQAEQVNRQYEYNRLHGAKDKLKKHAIGLQIQAFSLKQPWEFIKKKGL